MSNVATTTAPFMTPEQLLAHWQAHRRLSRRVIEAFPEDQLFTYSIGGMRTFGVLALEMIGMAAPLVRGLVTGEWGEYSEARATTRPELLRQWDESTSTIDQLWPQLSPEIFQETRTAFGQYTAPVYDLLLYTVDNEINHRGQVYVYLRALGIEPPTFYVRD